MKKKNFCKKIKSEQGLTGIDIITAITIVVITITVVSMIYVNTTVESRNITRTAGATRIVTNILENIEKLSYDEFLANFNSEIQGLDSQTDADYLGYYLLDGGVDNKVFSTKIPNGYSLYIKCEPNYGTHTEQEKQFDLLRTIDIIITFNVGDRTEKIDFNTVKTREIIEETNTPNTNYLSLESGMYFYPVKYLDSSEVYIKVTEKDSSWYNYSNKRWATVIVSKQTEDEIFDINGKFIGIINTTKTEETYTERFVWIPRFFKKTVHSVDTFYAFSYLATGNNKIVSTVLNSNKGESSTLNINTYEEITSDEISTGVNTVTTNFGDKSGKWVSCEIDKETGKTGIANDTEANLLNISKYGPYTASM